MLTERQLKTMEKETHNALVHELIAEVRQARARTLDREQSCYACANYSLCYLRHKLRAIMVDAGGCGLLNTEARLDGVPTWQVIFALIGNICKMFERLEKE